jgi:hypothetical protein
LFRFGIPSVREEIKQVLSSQEEKLLSPAETCKLFVPNITKATLSSWTAKGYVEVERIGGRLFYKLSEILEKTKKIGKYKNKASQ